MSILWSKSIFDTGEFTHSDEELRSILSGFFTLGIVDRVNYNIISFKDYTGIVVHTNETFVRIDTGDLWDTLYFQVSFDTEIPNGLSKAKAIEHCFQLIKKSWSECVPRFKCVNTGSSVLLRLFVGDPYQGDKYLIDASIRNNNLIYTYREENLSHKIVAKHQNFRFNGDVAASQNSLLEYLDGKLFNSVSDSSKVIFNKNEFNFINL